MVSWFSTYRLVDTATVLNLPSLDPCRTHAIMSMRAWTLHTLYCLHDIFTIGLTSIPPAWATDLD